MYMVVKPNFHAYQGFVKREKMYAKDKKGLGVQYHSFPRLLSRMKEL